jgi:hypothetical protein
VEEHLITVVSTYERDWDERLSIFLLAYRASKNEATGMTPANMVFRGELRLPCDLLLGAPPDKKESTTDCAANLAEWLRNIPLRPSTLEGGQ